MKKKWLKREGGIYDKFGQMIRETGYSKPVNIELATVVEAPPNLRIKTRRGKFGAREGRFNSCTVFNET